MSANEAMRTQFEAWAKNQPDFLYWNTSDAAFAAFCAGRSALASPAQPEAQPVMFNGLTEAETSATASVAGLAHPTQPEVLTDEQIKRLRKTCVGLNSGELHISLFARAIERAVLQRKAAKEQT